jgi:phosphonate transport system ATP-binding protein
MRASPASAAEIEIDAPVSPIITVTDATKLFKGKRALHALSCTILPGQFVAIVGKSGAGKTTLLRCLGRATGLNSGHIRFGRDDVAALRGRALRGHRARVGMIYQQFNLVKRLRVIDNVLVGRLAHVRGLRRWATLGGHFDGAERVVALRCLEHVGLLDRVWQRTDTLSGGEQQRVAIAKILAQQPGVILADEPIASLDIANGTLVLDTLRRISSRAGLTVVTTLHHVALARRYADRVLGLREGRLVFDGTPAQMNETAMLDIFGELPSEYLTETMGERAAS